jgi:hypothetical protein
MMNFLMTDGSLPAALGRGDCALSRISLVASVKLWADKRHMTPKDSRRYRMGSAFGNTSFDPELSRFDGACITS